MQAASHEAIVRWLEAPEAYPQRPERVEHVETHISHVFLAGSNVYKLKKPVKYDFLDYTRLAAREQACREEVRLNRRLAPDAYLGVVPVAADAGRGFQLGGAGEVVDWLVHMRRLPTELALDALYLRGELSRGHIDRLADVLVGFYRSLPPLPISAEQYRERCLSHVRGNLRELLGVKHHLPRGMVERVHGFQLQLLKFQPALFDARVVAGRVVDGHGDLRPEHICLAEPIQIFDCIEFSADFRRIDVADELAFLAEECDFLGAEWVGPQLLAAYEGRTGDRVGSILFDFYKAYRACVRAKVAALRADQNTGPARQVAATEAQRYLALADKYAAGWLGPLVIVVGGLSGTGKTTLAKALAEAVGAELLRTDVIRKEIHGGQSAAAAANSGVYSHEGRRRVYDELLSRAAALHGEQISVVLDGTFASAELLRAARDGVANSRSVFLAVECTCRTEVARERIAGRLAAGSDASDAGADIHDLQQQTWQAWPGDVPNMRIDTEQPVERQVEQVIAVLAAPTAR